MCFFAISIIYRICIIQFVEGNYWREKDKAYTTKIEDMEAVCGNIFDANGALLATSLPFYEIAMDINAPSITDKSFNNNRDSLAYLLNNLFQDKSTKEYINILIKSRNKNRSPNTVVGCKSKPISIFFLRASCTNCCTDSANNLSKESNSMALRLPSPGCDRAKANN